MTEVAGTEVRHNVEGSRYELTVAGRLVGVADYRLTDGHDTVVFPHTEILPSERGRGLGAELVRGALDDVRASGRRVVPQCWYVAQFIDEHAEYGDLLGGP